METINLGRSRYGDDRYLSQIMEGKWSTSGFKKLSYISVSPIEGEPGCYLFIDPDGGPFLQLGMGLPNGETIRKIQFEDGRYLIITDKFTEEVSIDV